MVPKFLPTLFFHLKPNHMTTQSKIRFERALALIQKLTMDTDKLSGMIDLIISEPDRKVLWRDIKEEGDVTNARLTPLHVIIFGCCQMGFHTELEQDAAYLLCMKQIIGARDEDLSIYFRWYTGIPKDRFALPG